MDTPLAGESVAGRRRQNTYEENLGVGFSIDFLPVDHRTSRVVLFRYLSSVLHADQSDCPPTDCSHHPDLAADDVPACSRHLSRLSNSLHRKADRNPLLDAHCHIVHMSTYSTLP